MWKTVKQEVKKQKLRKDKEEKETKQELKKKQHCAPLKLSFQKISLNKLLIMQNLGRILVLSLQISTSQY